MVRILISVCGSKTIPPSLYPPLPTAFIADIRLFAPGSCIARLFITYSPGDSIAGTVSFVGV